MVSDLVVRPVAADVNVCAPEARYPTLYVNGPVPVVGATHVIWMDDDVGLVGVAIPDTDPGGVTVGGGGGGGTVTDALLR